MSNTAVARTSVTSHQEDASMWEIARRISATTGIILGKGQESLIRNRISKRIRELKIRTFADYLTRLETDPAEMQTTISLLTTHHTYFFREFGQFDYLLEGTLERLVTAIRKAGRREIRIWSPACSTGHEVYSMAMFFDHELRRLAPDFTFKIFGSDICEDSVKTAKKGRYPWDQLKESPIEYLGTHWRYEQDGTKRFAQIKPELAAKCSFEVLNLVDLPAATAQDKYDLIVCRNVFIYFDNPTMNTVVQALTTRLDQAGCLLLGLSESLSRGDAGSSELKHLGKSIYVRPEVASVAAPVAQAAPFKVLCVDDSPTVLKLLEKIFTKEEGFECVGTVLSATLAVEFLKTNPVDIVTLDIHMPEMNGVEYLEKHFKPDPKHPPVVMVSSVSREDASLAVRALMLGASDYVEKPALKDLNLRADELRSKLRTAVKAGRRKTITKVAGDRFKLTPVIQDAETKLRVVSARPGDLEKLEFLVSNLKAPQPATVIAVDGLSTLGAEFVAKLKTLTTFEVGEVSPGRGLKSELLGRNSIWICEESESILLGVAELKRQTCHLLLKETKFRIEGAKRIAEETAESQKGFRIGLESDELVPFSGLVYESDRFFASTQNQEQTFKVGESNGLLAWIEAGKVRVFEGTVAQICDDLFAEAEGQGQKRRRELRGIEVKWVMGAKADGAPLDRLLARLGVSVTARFEAKYTDLSVRVGAGRGRVQVRDQGPAPLLVKPTAAPAPLSPLKKKKVLIVDDSASIRKLLRAVVERHPALEVVAEASLPSQVEPLILKHSPDVITLDVYMPEMNGTDLLEKLLPKYRIPTVMISSLDPNESTEFLRALEIGAFDCIQKPSQEKLSVLGPEIAEVISLAASSQPLKVGKSLTQVTPRQGALTQAHPIFVGASTGGTEAIKRLFCTLPAEIPPILVAQHIPAFFSKAFATRLNELFPFEVREAVDGDLLKPGLVLVAPGGRQMEVEKSEKGTCVRISEDTSKALHKPSVDRLFLSAAKIFKDRATAIILTGMGNDGSLGLRALKSAGALTLAQDAESCVVYGMPKAALESGGITHQFSLEKMVDAIRKGSR